MITTRPAPMTVPMMSCSVCSSSVIAIKVLVKHQTYVLTLN
jgi:hypothetical protein